MMDADQNTLDVALRDAILERLGFSAAPIADLDGLRAVYRAWCEHVPFENVGKVIALRSGTDTPLPGRFALGFFQAWLAHGSGGTCWSTANALHELLVSLGFRSRRAAAHMRDAGITNHGTVIVSIAGAEWLVDSSLLTHVPLPLTSETFLGKDPVFSAEVEHVDGTHVLWTYSPPAAAHFPCRIFPEEAAHEEYLQRYEISRERSPFNGRLYAGTTRGREVLLLVGNVRWTRSDKGVTSRALTRNEVLESLRQEFRMSGDFLHRWAAVGGLESAFEEASGPPPPLETRKPPSQR
jgi:N-hydroxyarylamine O-acetyltransferase